jgi:hypothetical protein
MIGSYLWNLIIGGLSGLLAFAFAFTNANTFLTSLTRGMISFAVMFLLTFLFRWLLALIIQDTQEDDLDKAQKASPGAKIDLQTPEQDIELADILNTSPAQADEKQAFEPFQPPRLKRVDKSGEQAVPDPALAAKAVRRLTED